MKVISNLRPYDLNSLSFHVIVFRFELDWYRKFIDHYERCILVHYYHSCQFKFKSIPNIVFQSHCTQTHTHIHLYLDLEKHNMRFLFKFYWLIHVRGYSNCLALAILTPRVSQSWAESQCSIRVYKRRTRIQSRNTQPVDPWL